MKIRHNKNNFTDSLFEDYTDGDYRVIIDDNSFSCDFEFIEDDNIVLGLNYDDVTYGRSWASEEDKVNGMKDNYTVQRYYPIPGVRYIDLDESDKLIEQAIANASWYEDLNDLAFSKDQAQKAVKMCDDYLRANGKKILEDYVDDAEDDGADYEDVDGYDAYKDKLMAMKDGSWWD